jgi:hypothetical protein
VGRASTPRPRPKPRQQRLCLPRRRRHRSRSPRFAPARPQRCAGQTGSARCRLSIPGSGQLLEIYQYMGQPRETWAVSASKTGSFSEVRLAKPEQLKRNST